MSRSQSVINLHSRNYSVIEILKPTKARLFGNFRIGTVFKVYLNLTKTTGGANGLYAMYFEVVNKDTEEACVFSQNELVNHLSKFKYSTRNYD